MRKLKKIIYGLLVVLSLGLIFNQQLTALLLKVINPPVTITKQKTSGNYDWQKVNNVSAYDLLKARLNSNKAKFIGLVAIPKLKMSLPISNGVADLNLSLGAGTLFKNQKMGEGNYALASHFIADNSMKNLLFTPIYYKGAVGQKIYLTDLEKVYTYQTTKYQKILATDLSVVQPVAGKKLVTLITCNYTEEAGRVVMQGELVKTRDWKETPKKIQQYFSANDTRWVK